MRGFQSTPPVKAATIVLIEGRNVYYLISIHAAREGGDYNFFEPFSARLIISIHAAREGGDVRFGAEQVNDTVFQSTPPVKAATSLTISTA